LTANGGDFTSFFNRFRIAPLFNVQSTRDALLHFYGQFQLTTKTTLQLSSGKQLIEIENHYQKRPGIIKLRLTVVNTFLQMKIVRVEPRQEEQLGSTHLLDCDAPRMRQKRGKT
jgi:hypothetical protein